MVKALKLLLTGCLLQTILCGKWEAVMPTSLRVLNGSCVTIPCSFDISSTSELDDSCKAMWKNSKGKHVFDSRTPTSDQIKGHLTGSLKSKDCSTTLINMQHGHSDSYSLRLECNGPIKYTYQEQLQIKVEADPPTPTVTPSSVSGKEGSSVTLWCWAPAPCPSRPPTLTWTPGLGHGLETLQENQDRTKNQTSALTFTASHLHHGLEISCTAAYSKEDGTTKPAVSSSVSISISYSPKNVSVSVSPSGAVPADSVVTLTCSSDANPAATNYTWHRADGGQEAVMGNGAKLNLKASEGTAPFFCEAENIIGRGRSNATRTHVQFAPKILLSSDCAKPADPINCSCDTVGNPAPTIRWYLDGFPVNGSEIVTIKKVNGTALRSIITVTRPEEKNLSTLFCLSTNTLGSATHAFCVDRAGQSQGPFQGPMMMMVFITAIVALLLLACALLYVIRGQNARLNLQNHDASKVAMGHLARSEEENEVPITVDNDIYANTSALKQTNEPISGNSTDLPRFMAENTKGNGQSPEKKHTGGENDLIYSDVTWTSKKKEEKKSAMEPQLVRKETECEYSQVEYKSKEAMNK